LSQRRRLQGDHVRTPLLAVYFWRTRLLFGTKSPALFAAFLSRIGRTVFLDFALWSQYSHSTVTPTLEHAVVAIAVIYGGDLNATRGDIDMSHPAFFQTGIGESLSGYKGWKNQENESLNEGDRVRYVLHQS